MIPRDIGKSWSKSRLWLLFKVSVSFGLLAYLVWIIDWDQIAVTLAKTDLWLVLVSPLFWFVTLSAGALRWRLFLADKGVHFKFRQAVTGYFIGSFYNVFLPGVTGGDAVRAGYCVARTKCSVGTAVASVIVERITGVLALITFLASVMVLRPAIFEQIRIQINLADLLPLVLATGVLALLVATAAIWVQRRKLITSRDGFFLRLWTRIRGLGTIRPRTLMLMIFCSLAFQGIRIIGMVMLARAIGISVPAYVFFAVAPLVYFTTMLPISLGGLGLREGTFVYLLSLFGVHSSSAIMLALLIYLNQVILAVSGGVIQLFSALCSGKRELAVDSQTGDDSILGLG